MLVEKTLLSGHRLPTCWRVLGGRAVLEWLWWHWPEKSSVCIYSEDSETQHPFCDLQSLVAKAGSDWRGRNPFQVTEGELCYWRSDAVI